jgi:nucleoside-diphosphate-sugar epimerase
MKILLTGGSGFLGSALTISLIEKNDVFILSRAISKNRRIQNILNKINLLYFENYDQIESIIKTVKPDIVIHTACSYGRKSESLKEIFDANYFYGLAILNSLKIINQKIHFINFDTILSPLTNYYSFSKNQFSNLGLFISNDSNNKIRFLNIKLQHIYGPDDDLEKFSSYIIQSCYNNVDSINLTLGDQKRDFIYIDDVVSAIHIILKNINDLKTNQIELGSGKTITIKKFVLTIHKLTKSKSNLCFGSLEYRKDELMYSKANISQLSKLGWFPKYSLKDGIKNILKNDFV